MASNLPTESHDDYKFLKENAINYHERRQYHQIKERIKSIKETFINILTISMGHTTLSIPNCPDQFIKTSLQYIRKKWNGPQLKKENWNDKKKMTTTYFNQNVGNWICRHAKNISYPCIFKYIKDLRDFLLLNICQNDRQSFGCIWYSFWKQILVEEIRCNGTRLDVIPAGLLFDCQDIQNELKLLFDEFGDHEFDLEGMKNSKKKEFKNDIKQKVDQLPIQFTANYQPHIKQPHPTQTEAKIDLSPQITNPPNSNSTIDTTPNSNFNTFNDTMDDMYTTTTSETFHNASFPSIVMDNHQNSDYTHYPSANGLNSSGLVVNQTQPSAYIQDAVEQKMPTESQVIRQQSVIPTISNPHNNNNHHHHGSINYNMYTQHGHHMNNRQNSDLTHYARANGLNSSAYIQDVPTEPSVISTTFNTHNNYNNNNNTNNNYDHHGSINHNMYTQHSCHMNHRQQLQDQHPMMTNTTLSNSSIQTHSNVATDPNVFPYPQNAPFYPDTYQFVQQNAVQQPPSYDGIWNSNTQQTQYSCRDANTNSYHGYNHIHNQTFMANLNDSQTQHSNTFSSTVNVSVNSTNTNQIAEDHTETHSEMITQQPMNAFSPNSNIFQIEYSNHNEIVPRPNGYNSSHNANYTTSFNRYTPY